MPSVDPGLVRCSSTAIAVGAVTSSVGVDEAGFGFHLRQTEVENFGVSALGDENVGRLDVAMNNALGVGGVERIGDFDAQGENRFQFHGAGADQVLERDAVKKFHDQKGAAVFLADVVDRADVGMVERRGGLGLAAEALERLTVLRQIFRQELQRDEAAEARVFGFVNHAHAAAAELLDDPIVGDGLIEQRRRPSPWFSHARSRAPGSQKQWLVRSVLSDR